MLETPSLLASQKPADRDDVGYVLGWFCGGILVLGVVVAVVYLIQGSRRKAFHAAVLPVVELLCLVLTIALASSLERINTKLSDVASFLFFAELIFLPILGVYLLRKIPWPATKKPAQ